MPFGWDELDQIHPRLFTMASVFERVTEAGDPFLPVATGPGQSLDRALEELGPRTA